MHFIYFYHITSFIKGFSEAGNPIQVSYFCSPTPGYTPCKTTHIIIIGLAGMVLFHMQAHLTNDIFSDSVMLSIYFHIPTKSMS